MGDPAHGDPSSDPTFFLLLFFLGGFKDPLNSGESGSGKKQSGRVVSKIALANLTSLGCSRGNPPVVQGVPRPR